jgi:hypothetical protein
VADGPWLRRRLYTAPLTVCFCDFGSLRGDPATYQGVRAEIRVRVLCLSGAFLNSRIAEGLDTFWSQARFWSFACAWRSAADLAGSFLQLCA